ncbi:MAG: hypothetical protein ACOY4K_00510 [Pseudomonadota bacterium]
MKWTLARTPDGRLVVAGEIGERRAARIVAHGEKVADVKKVVWGWLTKP